MPPGADLATESWLPALAQSGQVGPLLASVEDHDALRLGEAEELLTVREMEDAANELLEASLDQPRDLTVCLPGPRARAHERLLVLALEHPARVRHRVPVPLDAVVASVRQGDANRARRGAGGVMAAGPLLLRFSPSAHILEAAHGARRRDLWRRASAGAYTGVLFQLPSLTLRRGAPSRRATVRICFLRCYMRDRARAAAPTGQKRPRPQTGRPIFFLSCTRTSTGVNVIPV